MLTDEPGGVAARRDGSLLDRRSSRVKFVVCGRGDGDEAGGAQDAVPGGQVGFLLEYVLVLCGRIRVFDPPDLATLSVIGDELSPLLLLVAGGLVGTGGRVEQGEGVPERSQSGREPAASLPQGGLFMGPTRWSFPLSADYSRGCDP